MTIQDPKPNKLEEALFTARLVTQRRVNLVSDAAVLQLAEALIVTAAQLEIAHKLDGSDAARVDLRVKAETERCAQVAESVGGVAGKSIAAEIRNPRRERRG
jgi:hypothetical protein